MRAAACIIWPGWQYPHWGTSTAVQAFDSGDALACYRADGRLAGPHGISVEMHGARTAKGLAATELGSGFAQGVTQNPEKRGVGCNIDTFGFPVEVEGNQHF